jgi:ribonuclease VapC
MFVDASAIIAILTREADADELSDKLDKAGFVVVSPLVRYEAIVALARKKWLGSGGENGPMPAGLLDEAETHLSEFLREARSREIPITSEIGTAAIRAMARYGRGTGHPAGLNFGDCFSYACAKSAGVPLLFKGQDFIHTDIEPA